jgi:hypothetical protein
MQKTKIIIALAALTALTLVIVGLASAQIKTNQTNTTTSPNTAPNNGFWGWIGNCFGYANNQVYNGQNTAPQAPTDNSAPAPYQPYQGGYNYGYGYGPCWAR